MENNSNDNIYIFDVDENTFVEKVIEQSADKIIIADFWAPWCAPCKQLTPVLEEIINETEGLIRLAKINIDKNQQLAAQLKIQSIPTVIAFHKKQIVNGFQGVQPKPKIIEFIEKVYGSPLPKNKDAIYKDIYHLIEINKLDEAQNLIEDSLAENSNDAKIISLYIRCLCELNKFKDEGKKIRKAKETMEIYAPLADRMGMNRIRDELEDLSFSILNKDARKLILDRLAFIKNKREDLINKVSEKLTELLKANKIDAEITGREKTPFSIWRKMQSKRISLEQLTDIVGFRVILKNINDCYVTLGVFHNKYSMIPGKFKDYISTPKINQYQSIHTSVIGPLKKRIEIQIRTESMHEFAERGIASHWKYKSSEKFSELSWKEYDWLKDLVEIMETGGSPEHYFEFTKLQMFQDNVFCFTPKGAVIKLPRDGTPVDFAYAVHTKVGDTAIACEINGNSSALQTTLRNGDMVKIITSKKVSPSLHWLSSSKTGKARASIRKHWQGRLLKNEEITKVSPLMSV